MRRISFTPRVIFSFCIFSLVTSCSVGTRSNENNDSRTLVSDQQHTIVKRQSIGNCWLYATASWAEALYLNKTGKEIDLSESYWTWWWFYYQLAYKTDIAKIQTGGSWSVSSQILASHGVIEEAKFIPDEAGTTMSIRQAQAEAYINQQLSSGGKLSTKENRTEENIKKELDKAFGTNMKEAEQYVVKAKDFIVGTTKDGKDISLFDSVGGSQYADGSDSPNMWQQVDVPQIVGKDVILSQEGENERANVMFRVLKALNDHQPVLISVMIDFNALDIVDATFKASRIEQPYQTGSQGGHMVVLDDYAVDDAPFIGTIPEGEAISKLTKILATRGKLRYLKAKNSWGANRPERGLTDGYTRFSWEYLSQPLPWKDEKTGQVEFYSGLSEVILPAGY